MKFLCWILTSTVAVISQSSLISAGRAPMGKPDLPEGFCPRSTGIATATTGECMCRWQHKDGCVGSKCQYEMGLSWYHYTCQDCQCVSEPK